MKEEHITAVRQHRHPLGAHTFGALTPCCAFVRRGRANQPHHAPVVPAPSGGGVGWGRVSISWERAPPACPSATSDFANRCGMLSAGNRCLLRRLTFAPQRCGQFCRIHPTAMFRARERAITHITGVLSQRLGNNCCQIGVSPGVAR